MPTPDHVWTLRQAAAAADRDRLRDGSDSPAMTPELGPALLALAADLMEMDGAGSIDLGRWPAARVLVVDALRQVEDGTSANG